MTEQSLSADHQTFRAKLAAGEITLDRARPKWTDRLNNVMPQLAVTPAFLAALLLMIGALVWTIYLSFTNATSMPSYEFAGLVSYEKLWANPRWILAYTNLFAFSVLFIALTLAAGLGLAVLMDQNIRGEALFRSIFLYPMAISLVVTGTVWRWLFNPGTGIEAFVRGLGWDGFVFDWIVQKDKAIYVIVFTAIWQSSGFIMVLFLAGLRSVDQSIIKAAQIDGASMGRIYRRIIFPMITPIFISCFIILLQNAIKTYELVGALTSGGPGTATTVPAMFVFDVFYARGQIGQGAAGAVMMLLAIVVFLIPFNIYQRIVRKREA
jgi:glucose/mannose transport system permease protein